MSTAPFSQPLVLQAGTRPLPEYELIRQRGVGGFGEVWQARGPGGFDVALKFVRLEARGSEFEVRALEIMKRIRHPNLVGLFGVWPKEGWLIVAMELCDCSLHDRLQAARQQHLPGLPIKELLKYMQQAAEGLDALNAQGVQHRDVKPRNLMLVGNGVKVADFGLAKVLEQSQAVHSGSMTMAYSPPESFQGTLAAQSDQYSLAVTYYELRTGRLPFSGDAKAIMYAHLEKTPDLSPLPAEERPVLARALAKEPKERWKNCKAFVNELIKAHQRPKSGPVNVQPKPKPDDIFQQKTLLTPELGKQQTLNRAVPKSERKPGSELQENEKQFVSRLRDLFNRTLVEPSEREVATLRESLKVTPERANKILVRLREQWQKSRHRQPEPPVPPPPPGTKVEPGSGEDALRGVADLDELSVSLRNFNSQAKANEDVTFMLMKRTKHWVYDSAGNAFGPCKFVGFANMDFSRYSKLLKGELLDDLFDGRFAKKQIESVANNSFAIQPDLHVRLQEWADRLLGRQGVLDGVSQKKWHFLVLDPANQ